MSTLTVPHLTHGRHYMLAAAITSQIAAVIMAVVMIAVFYFILRTPPLYPVQVIGSTIYGEDALNGFQFKAVLAGLVLHLIVALAWGLVFAMIASYVAMETAGKAALYGLLVAFVSMVDSYLFVPMVMHSLHGVDIWRREVPMFWNWAAHLVFGLSFAFYPVVDRWLEKRR